MKEEEKEPDRDNYKELFENIGYKRSKKLVHYLMQKVINKYKEDFDNPKRLYLIEQIRDMREPFNNVFKRDFN